MNKIINDKKKTITKPIKINNQQILNVKEITFDPSESSPPNSFILRTSNRLNIFYKERNVNNE
jgi:hypothetical protein